MTYDMWHLAWDTWHVTHTIKKILSVRFLSVLVSVLLSANVERFSIFHMWDFSKHFQEYFFMRPGVTDWQVYVNLPLIYSYQHNSHIGLDSKSIFQCGYIENANYRTWKTALQNIVFLSIWHAITKILVQLFLNLNQTGPGFLMFGL